MLVFVTNKYLKGAMIKARMCFRSVSQRYLSMASWTNQGGVGRAANMAEPCGGSMAEKMMVVSAIVPPLSLPFHHTPSIWMEPVDRSSLADRPGAVLC